ncbi:MAG: AsmA family protein [Rhizobiaceae bacterium]
MRFFAFLGSLLVLALLAALIAPSYIDWNQFKSRFEQEAGLTLGLPVKVKGTAGIRLLPLPSVTFTEVEVGASADQAPILVADSFKIDIELAPLLKGNVVVVDMQMASPTLNIELDEQGHLNVPDFASPRQELQGANVSLENISITNGRVQVSDARFDRTIEIVDIDATASAKLLTGPWQVEGTATRDENRYRVGVLTGSWQETEQIRLTVQLEAQDLPYDLEFSGPLSMKGGVPSWKGALKLAPMGNQSNDELIAFRRPGRDAAFPIRVESELELVSGGATVPSFELKIGDNDDPYTLTGNGQAVFGEDISFRVRAEGQQVNVERFSKQQGVGIDFSQRLAIFREFLARIPQFEADGEINLYLPAVVAGDTVIREVGMDLRPAPLGAGWQISNLEAQLPGRTELRADGQLLLGDNFGYQGELILASSQPSGFAKWLGSEVSPAIRDLSAAGFSANALVSGELIEFDNVEIILNKEVLKGSIRRNAVDGARPELVAKLEGDAVDFDQISSLFDLFAGGNASGGGGGDDDGSGSGSKRQNFVDRHDLDLDLKANSMAIADLKASNVVAKLAIKGDTLSIDQLEIGDMYNAALNVAGVVEGIASQPVGRFSGSFNAQDPSYFLDVINKRFGPYPLVQRFVEDRQLIQGTELALEFEATEEGYSLKSAGRTGGSELEARLSSDDFAKPLDQQQIDVELIAVNAEAAQLMLQFGVPVVPLQDTGRAAFRVTSAGTVEQGLQTNATLTVSGGYLSGEGTIKPLIDEDQLTIDGNLKVKGELQDFDRAILLSGLPVPGFGNGNSFELETLLSINGSRFQSRDLKGRLGDAKFSGELTLKADKRPRPELRGSLSLTTLDGPTLASLVYTGAPGETPITETGDVLISQPVLAGLDAKLSISADVVDVLSEYPPARALTADLEVENGDISLQSISANWLTGAIKGDLSMAQSTAGRALNGQLQLVDGDIGLVSRLAGLPRGLAGKLSLAGTFETTGNDSNSMLSQITASGTMAINDASISGLNSEAFAGLLRAADTIEDDKLADQAESLLEAQFADGKSAFEDIELPFTVATGSLRINSFALQNQKIKIAGSSKYELASRLAEVDARVTYDPGKETVVGAQPEFTLSALVADGALNHQLDASLFSTYLGMRVSERREREFEAQRSEILERQRLQQVTRIYALKEQVRLIAEAERERIRLLELEQEEQRRREEARRRREEIERKRIEAEILAAEKRAAREAALEAGRRERRQEEIDLLREQAKEAADRIRLETYDDATTVDGEAAPTE